jgi:hypothetical protein
VCCCCCSWKPLLVCLLLLLLQPRCGAAPGRCCCRCPAAAALCCEPCAEQRGRALQMDLLWPDVPHPASPWPRQAPAGANCIVAAGWMIWQLSSAPHLLEPLRASDFNIEQFFRHCQISCQGRRCKTSTEDENDAAAATMHCCLMSKARRS